MTKKKVAIIASIVIAVILLIAGVSYAYYSANVKEVNKTETVIKTDKLTLVFTGTNEITNGDNMIPGDSFTKTFTVENTSDVDTKYNIYMENITNEFNEDLVYVLSDENGVVVEETPLPVTNAGKSYLISDIEIASKELKTYTLKIEYKYLDTPQNDYQGALFTATLGIDTNKLESEMPVAKACSLTSDVNQNGTADTGDLITCNTESFYVMTNDGTNIKMLSQYNLYVGGEREAKSLTGGTPIFTAYGEEATGLQDSDMLAYDTGDNTRRGVTQYSNDTKKGTNYSDYNGSIVEEYVNNYKTILTSLGVQPLSVSLITIEELDKLGCSSANETCEGAPDFVLLTSYWTSTPYGTNGVYRVATGGGLSNPSQSTLSYFGVRPVVTISIDSI